MNAQFKKGVLELIVLESVRKRDMYGYELVAEVSKVVDVNEGTIYPLSLIHIFALSGASKCFEKALAKGQGICPEAA